MPEIKRSDDPVYYMVNLHYGEFAIAVGSEEMEKIKHTKDSWFIVSKAMYNNYMIMYKAGQHSVREAIDNATKGL